MSQVIEIGFIDLIVLWSPRENCKARLVLTGFLHPVGFVRVGAPIRLEWSINFPISCGLISRGDDT